MATILDLPDEIHLLIAKHLQTETKTKTIYSLIRVCRSFYSSYIPCLWSELVVQPEKGNAILEQVVRTNAHLVETVTLSPNQPSEYYIIDFPRLHSLRLESSFGDKRKPCYSNILLAHKIDFVRRHPFIRTLICGHKDAMLREFWEVIGTEWTHLEVLNFSGVVKENVQDAFWRVCDQVQCLSLWNVNILPEHTPILSTLSFHRLQKLAVSKYAWSNKFPYRGWPSRLLEQVKMSPGLKRLRWSVSDIMFPVQRFHEMLAEDGCWPALCELDIDDAKWTDQGGAEMLRLLPSRRLTAYVRTAGGRMESLTFNCLKEMYFGHLRELNVRRCKGITSVMVQEILTECVHLVHFEAAHIFVRDIATASKPWSCLQLERLVIYIAKEPKGKAEWEGRVFEQISRVRRLLVLDLQRPCTVNDADRVDPNSMDSLDLRLPCFRLKDSSNTIDGVEAEEEGDSIGDERGANISCWSSLVQLQQFKFNSDRKTFGVDEALWMVEHWKDLRFIVGLSRHNEGRKVEQLMTKAGVWCSKY
jgi:hypothetical protein